MQKKPVLVLGSCRVLVTLANTKDPSIYWNTWPVNCNRRIRPNHVIGRTWSSIEALSFIQKFKFKSSLDGMLHHENEHNDVFEGMRKCADAFDLFGLFIIELSSYKYYSKNNNLLHSPVHRHLAKDNFIEQKLTDDKVLQNLEHIVELTYPRPVVFVSHFTHTNIPQRIKLANVSRQIETKYPDRVYVIEPYKDIPNFKRYISGNDHYRVSELGAIANELERVITQRLSISS